MIGRTMRPPDTGALPAQGVVTRSSRARPTNGQAGRTRTPTEQGAATETVYRGPWNDPPRVHQGVPERQGAAQTGRLVHRWRTELTQQRALNREQTTSEPATTRHPAGPIAAAETRTTNWPTEALKTGSVTPSHRHKIATDLQKRQQAALNRAALDHDIDAREAADAAERAYDPSTARLLELALLPNSSAEKRRELEVGIPNSALDAD